MHLTTCESPVLVHINGEDRYVPCGKCMTCRFIRSSQMADRAKYEIQQHKYAIFGSLSYADIFLPKYTYDFTNRGFVRINPVESYDDDTEGYFVSWPYLEGNSKTFIQNRLEKFGYVSFLDKKDFQKFFKRLRININRFFKKYYPNESQSLEITYISCGEYGPTTKRPHGHFIICFDNDQLAKEIFHLVRKSWPYGSSKSRFLSAGEGANYIAKYVNGLYNLPKILQSKEFRPFLLVSKSHPIGLFKVTSQEIKESFNRRSATISIFDTKKGTFSDVPLWCVLENRLYPKFSGYHRFSHGSRVRLLEFAAKFQSIRELQESAFSCSYQLLGQFDSELKDDYNKFDIDVIRSVFEFDWVIPDVLKSYIELYGKSRCFIHSYRSLLDNALKGLFYCARHIVRNMHLYQVNSISDYLCIIDEYDYNKFVYNMERQFELESRLDDSHIRFIDCGSFSDELLQLPDFVQFQTNVYYEYKHSKKNRSNRDYLNLHPEYKLDVSQDDFSEGFV